MQKLLILGGTTEASAVAAMMAGDKRFDAMLSFAGATRAPRPPPIAFRVGGFGGAEGLARFLQDRRIDLLIDATHPFATQMTRNAAQAAAMTGVKLLVVLRPPWTPGDGDCWTMVSTMAAAAHALGPLPRRVLLTIGQKDLAAFQAAPMHHYVVRSIDPPDPASLPPSATAISARGPFLEADELALLRESGVEVMVTKNSGGLATQAKLAAARTLAIPVVMVQRPAPPSEGVLVADAAAAAAWLEAHAGTERGV